MSGKLSSRVVEVTILLSDIRSSNHKLIKIKPMELIREDANHLQEEVTSNVENTTIQTELQTAHETLQNLKEQQSRLIKETEAEIATERANWGTEKQTYVEQAKKEGYQAGYAHGKDRKSTRLNSSHVAISYAVFCLKKKKDKNSSHVHVTQTTHYV